MSAPVAPRLAQLVSALTGAPLGLRLRAWDGSVSGPSDAPATIVVRSPRAVSRLLWAPHELGLGRAYVAGDLDVEGDLYAALALLGGSSVPSLPAARAALRVAAEVGALRPPVAPPPEEARLSGLRHSKQRDAAAIAHHYDVSNDFYALFLGSTMTYSCAFWDDGVTTLDGAQVAKWDLVARKLGLQPGMRLLDVGCGWGGFVRHAARAYGVHAVGVTVSRRQWEWATKRVADDGLADLVDVRLQDYRDVADGPYDAISSIGMAEHVGEQRMVEYATRLRDLLAPGGRLLNHAIARPPGKKADRRRSFIWHYVFPDGELLPLGTTVHALEAAGLEVRDVEALREHYARTLRAWVANLDANWDEAVRLVGERRARIWRLYMTGSALSFEFARIGVNQVLAVRPHRDGGSGMPASRRSFV